MGYTNMFSFLLSKNMRLPSRSLLCTLIFIILSCTKERSKPEISNPVLIDYTVHRSFPHSVSSFTEGLLIHKGELYESSGEYGKSWVGIINIRTGEPDKKIRLSKEYFGEGITILNNKIYLLTYKEKTGFVYALDSFQELKRFSYETEGWGLTTDGKDLIMTDGSDNLFFLDTADLSITRKIKVTYNGNPVDNLNELEYINGYLYCNIWQTDLIAKIDSTGKVVGFLDLSKLTQQARMINIKIDVLNGIAWHESSKSLLVTGKYWPFIYALKLGI
jgi:glutamine cyclotransferase